MNNIKNSDGDNESNFGTEDSKGADVDGCFCRKGSDVIQRNATLSKRKPKCHKASYKGQKTTKSGQSSVGKDTREQIVEKRWSTQKHRGLHQNVAVANPDTNITEADGNIA
ncbi:hypothetical protein COV04_00330 [Candidatus Uhrbacteria bacterium CG10_big_fil_rev_8_21_14_0_10_48_11]|uniref:Uncharacterized protein n=1 Tax=Candidatus Uhrbacteria bacterium CG10_big_fil_rev_8_21_14_0_10_48_11 TaxID=1975037 RepID=A0A2M8LFV7_9BACT|nr:MAG: hypothetical protein COV04_00330 [Candidatus Uhrbacteria bacterium CG10_big_fil_rev_8_21_14_0_10_48_11]